MRALMVAVTLFGGLGIVTADTSTSTDELTKAVTLMARVGGCGSPTFSPDGKTLAFVCDLSGTPQVWTATTEGGWPTLVTALDDPVSSVEWSPSGNWLAISVAPGGVHERPNLSRSPRWQWSETLHSRRKGQQLARPLDARRFGLDDVLERT